MCGSLVKDLLEMRVETQKGDYSAEINGVYWRRRMRGEAEKEARGGEGGVGGERSKKGERIVGRYKCSHYMKTLFLFLYDVTT